jgi:hypothetical protein
MSIEMSRRIKVLQAEVTALRDRVGALEAAALPAIKVESSFTKTISGVAAAVPKYKPCPKCGVAPGYFFHVKNCKGQEKQKDDDRLGTNNTP